MALAILSLKIENQLEQKKTQTGKDKVFAEIGMKNIFNKLRRVSYNDIKHTF